MVSVRYNYDGCRCYEVSSVPWYQKKLATMIFATPPNSDFEESLQHFQQAEQSKFLCGSKRHPLKIHDVIIIIHVTYGDIILGLLYTYMYIVMALLENSTCE